MKNVSDSGGSDAYVDQSENQDCLLRSSVVRRKESDPTKPSFVASQPRGCARFITVEPAVFGTMFLVMLHGILSKEYFYQRIALQYNFTQNVTTQLSCEDSKNNESGPDYELHQKVSAETASLSLYLGIASE